MRKYAARGVMRVVLRGEELAKRLDERLAEYAVKNTWALDPSVRRHAEDPNPNDTRTPFQHDRDRIIHSRAFRRLRGKTQVFTATRGDHFRTRLSHTLEVAQMARSVARVFALNEDLTEAIALGHDLGHAPFGHSGERVLHLLLSGQRRHILGFDVGGFKHNLNSLNVVDFFERYFPRFPGLNLTRWTREGILKHTDLTYGDYGRVTDEVLDLSNLNIETDVPSFLEGQIVALCDEIAQVTHDLEDAFRATVLSPDNDALREVPVYEEAYGMVKESFDQDNFRNRLIRNLINRLVSDLIDGTEGQLASLPSVADQYGRIRTWIVRFSKDTGSQVSTLKEILREAVYASYEVSRTDIKGEMVIEKIFEAYVEKPERLTEYVFRKYNDVKATLAGDGGLQELNRSNVAKRRTELRNDRVFIRLVAAHIAGMTDTFAIQEYNDLFVPRS